MADSIAKLSVVITGDASPLGRATQQASGYVKQFETNTATSLTGIGNSAKAMNAVFSVASGNLGKLTALASLGPAAGLLIAAAAAGKLAYNLAAASDALEVASGAKAADTWAGQFDRVQAAALSIAQTLGRPLSEALTRETATWARILERVATAIMPEQIRQERALAASMEQRKKLADDLAKKEKEAAEAASKAFRESQDRARSAAQRITAALRTPGEIFTDTVAELNRLLEMGLLNIETMNRGLAKARADLVDASKIVRETKTMVDSYRGVGAAERNTAAGFSAVQAGRAELLRLTELAKQELEEGKRTTKAIADVEKAIKEKKPVTFMRSSL